jgi:asparagine synthase (glutamine-hydrolysing)
VCGIAGFIDKDPAPDVLPRMLARIAHRGPDGEGQWYKDDGLWRIGLGHRRLAIIDIADGAQPMRNDDATLVITYNGEVYNFVKLRTALQRAGRQFRTRSDTEVILHHFDQHGSAGLHQLNGMFAFAVWDSRTRRLLLARDRTGIKPLYYAELPGGGIVFASELSALLAHPGIARDVSTEGLVSYFFSDYVHPPHSIVKSVRKLQPGHTISWSDGKLGEPRAFWQLTAPNRPPADDETLANELWNRLSQAVESQLVADVPVGIFLSGGLDSSTVATLAAGRTGHRMKAFSIGFADRTFDESGYARKVAAGLDVEHVQETLHEGNLLDVVDLALDNLDEPLADPSFLPTFLLSRLAARHVKVVVGGDGGDELWGGYPTYRAHGYAAVYTHVPQILKAFIGHGIAALPIDHRYQSLEWKLRRFTQRWSNDRVERHLRWMSSVDLPDLPRAIPGARGISPATLSTRLPGTDDWLNRLLALDLLSYLPGSVLTKVDRAAMAHGLEVRPPLLDNELLDWAFSLPSSVKFRRGQGKYLLKLAAKGKLPDEVIQRPKKGFGIPLAAWIRGPLKSRLETAIASSPVWDLKVLDRSVFRTWNEEHQSLTHDHSKPLWALFVLHRWVQQTSA